jgi:predicted aspartyl protease
MGVQQAGHGVDAVEHALVLTCQHGDTAQRLNADRHDDPFHQRTRPAFSRRGPTATRDEIRMRRRLGLLPLPLLAALLVCRAEACTVTQEAQVDLADAGSLRIVPVTVDGKPARFLFDTGAERTLVTPKGRVALSLPVDAWTSTGIRGIGGADIQPDATVASMEIGGVALSRRLGPIRSVAVVPAVPAVISAFGMSGILGVDLLSSHDVEWLNHGRKLVLHHTDGCSGAFLPWAFATAPLSFPRPFQPVVFVTVGGMQLRALIDTGSESSLITRRAAALLSSVAVASANTGATGIGPATLVVEARDFGPVSIGGLRLWDGPLYVAALPATGFDVLLGMDRLKSWRVWLSYATSQVMIGPDTSGP